MEKGSKQMSTIMVNENASTGSNPVIVFVQPTTKEKHFEKTFPKEFTKTLSILLLSVCGIVVLSQIILHSLRETGPESINALGTGYWCGIFFGFAGGIGMLANQRPSQCVIVAFLVMNIFAAIASVPLLVISAFGVNYHSNEIRTAFYGIQVAAACFGAVVSITASSMSCCAVCRGNKHPGQIIYQAQKIEGHQAQGEEGVPPPYAAVQFS